MAPRIRLAESDARSWARHVAAWGRAVSAEVSRRVRIDRALRRSRDEFVDSGGAPDAFADCAAQVAAYALLVAARTGRDPSALPAAPSLIATTLAAAPGSIPIPIPIPTPTPTPTPTPREDHLLEHLLAAWDAADRRRRGVYYTPDPLAAHIVDRVDTTLRALHGLAAGLAGDVTILDPAAGTGVFLRHAIHRIHAAVTAAADAGDAARAWREHVHGSLLDRLHGHEIIPAAQIACRISLALAIEATGCLLEGRAPDIRLGDALAAAPMPAPGRPAVILGNPPYAGIGTRARHTDRLLRDPIPTSGGSIPGYYEVDGRPLGERKTWLQDEYVKFLRLAQLHVAAAGSGVVGVVTNHGYLDNPTFRGVRRSLMAGFARLEITDLHGNAKKGDPDENVFAGVQQGVAIAILSRPAASRPAPGKSARGPAVFHASLRGTRAEKLARLAAGPPELRAIHPTAPWYLFAARAPAADRRYDSWPRLTDIFPVHSTGIVTARDDFVFDLDEPALLTRIAALRDPRHTDDALRAAYFRGKGSAKYPPGDSRGFKLPAARAAIAADPRWRARVRPCLYRPFDARPLYYAPWIVDWPRPDVMRHLDGRTLALVSTRQQSVDEPWNLIGVADTLVESCYLSNRTAEINTVFPLHRSAGAGRPPNLDPAFARDLPAELVLHWILAVLHDPEFRRRHAERLAIDFPRIPPPPRDPALLAAADRAGARLIDHYLLRHMPPEPIDLIGEGDRVISRIAWADRSIWINPGQRFTPVSSRAFMHRVGAYQPALKWLKDRRGRALTDGDIAHYRRIITALSGLSDAVLHVGMSQCVISY